MLVAIEPSSGSNLPAPAPRWARMQHKDEFDLVMSSRQRVRTSHLVLHVALDDTSIQTTGPTHRLGLVVPKRWARRAVTRNAIRRLSLVAFQQIWKQLPAGGYVLRLAHAWDPTHYPSAWSRALSRSVRAEVNELLQMAVTMPSAMKNRGQA